MDYVQRSKSTSLSPSITMRKAYLENSVMYAEISRCLFLGSLGDSLRETEVLGPEISTSLTFLIVRREALGVRRKSYRTSHGASYYVTPYGTTEDR